MAKDVEDVEVERRANARGPVIKWRGEADADLSGALDAGHVPEARDVEDPPSQPAKDPRIAPPSQNADPHSEDRRPPQMLKKESRRRLWRWNQNPRKSIWKKWQKEMRHGMMAGWKKQSPQLWA